MSQQNIAKNTFRRKRKEKAKKQTSRFSTNDIRRTGIQERENLISGGKTCKFKEIEAMVKAYVFFPSLVRFSRS